MGITTLEHTYFKKQKIPDKKYRGTKEKRIFEEPQNTYEFTLALLRKIATKT